MRWLGLLVMVGCFDAQLREPTPPPEAPKGRLVAIWTRDAEDVALVIARATRTGLVELAREPKVWVRDMRWIDARTLLVFERVFDPSEVRVRRFVDGVLVHSTPIRLPKVEAHESTFEFAVDPRGNAWLVGCEHRPARCDYVAIDQSPRASAAPPTDAVLTHQVMARLPEVLAPAGLQASLARVTIAPYGALDHAELEIDGFTCSDGTTRVAWPELYTYDDIRPTRLRWTRASPPLFVLDGIDRYTGRPTRRFVRGCSSELVKRIHWLGHGLWAEPRRGEPGFEIVGPDGPIATLATAVDISVAPS